MFYDLSFYDLMLSNGMQIAYWLFLRACVDTSEKGELEKCKVLTNYKDSHEYGTFSYHDMLNYTVRILPEENILQIVTDSSSNHLSILFKHKFRNFNLYTFKH